MQDTFLKRHLIVSAVMGVVLMVLGIIMLFQQESFVKVFISLLGLFLIGSGLLSVFNLKRFAVGPRTKVANIIKALLTIVLGLVAVIVPLTTAYTSWNVLLYSIGAVLAFSALISFMDALLLKHSSVSVSSLLFDGVFSVVVAVLLFLFPQEIGTLLLKLVGALLIVSGLLMVLWAQKINKLNKQSTAKVIETKAEIMED